MNLFIVFLFGFTILIGTILVLLKNNKKTSELSISMAFSVLFLLIFLELIPESLSHIDYKQMILFASIGILSLKLIDIFIPEHDHTHKKDHSLHIGLISMTALVLHNLIEGMALYIALANETHLGIMLGIGVGLHNIPMGMIIASTLKQSKYDNLKIIVISSFISLSTFVGALIIHFIGNINEYYLGILLSLTLGMIVYIVFFELLEHMLHQDKKNNIKGFIIGSLLILISLLFHRH